LSESVTEESGGLDGLDMEIEILQKQLTIVWIVYFICGNFFYQFILVL
jgi:hypothetical protein